MEAALRQLTRESQMWHRQYREVWFGADDPAIDLDGRKRLPKSTRELLDEAVDTLQSLRHDIEQSLAVFDAVQQVKKKPVRKR